MGEGGGMKNFRLKMELLELNPELRKSRVTPEFTVSGNGAWRKIRPESPDFVLVDDFAVLELKVRER